jgi:hypothetical protein
MRSVREAGLALQAAIWTSPQSICAPRHQCIGYRLV